MIMIGGHPPAMIVLLIIICLIAMLVFAGLAAWKFPERRVSWGWLAVFFFALSLVIRAFAGLDIDVD
jgi:hypothetical protein